MTKSNTCIFATVLCLIPENFYGLPCKKTRNGRAAGCQLFYRKIYGYFWQCTISVVLRGCQLVTSKREIILSSIFVIMDLSNEQGKANGRCLRVRNRLSQIQRIKDSSRHA